MCLSKAGMIFHTSPSCSANTAEIN
jgi:hypothetical protein